MTTGAVKYLLQLLKVYTGLYATIYTLKPQFCESDESECLGLKATVLSRITIMHRASQNALEVFMGILSKMEEIFENQNVRTANTLRWSFPLN